jgi:hypothetical protein
MRHLVWIWAALVGPLIASTLIGGPMGLLPHLVYHPVYSALSVAGIYAAIRVRSSASSGAQQFSALVVAVAVVVIILGQLGQELAVLTHGGLHAGGSVLTEPFHVASAMVSLAGVVAAGVMLIVLTALTVTSRRPAAL